VYKIIILQEYTTRIGNSIGDLYKLSQWNLCYHSSDAFQSRLTAFPLVVNAKSPG
jgi:hypothetical protein